MSWQFRLPADAIFSVEATAQRLARLVSAGDSDLAHLREEASTLASLLGPIRAGRDPYVGRTGALHRAWRSPLDGTLQEFSLYVPARYRAGEGIALIVGLHGLHGGAHRMLPVLVGQYDEGEDRTRAERHLPPMPDTGAMLLAPYGYGDAGYRQQGEVDVMAAIDAVTASYAVNPDRIYLTGLSMGGIGAAGVAFHHPDRFAAIAPLCGYHSYFVRSDTRTVRRPWEVFLMELRSNASYAENGLHLPMYLVHGTLDTPTANSQVLVDRYQALGYDREVEWPVLGHNVWSQTYADGRIIPHFLRFQRDPAPRHVRFRTPELRWNRSAWLTLDALLAPGATDGARLARTMHVELAAGAQLTLLEIVVFGRIAHDEVVKAGTLGDRWRIHRDGRLVLAEDVRLEGEIEAMLARPALGGGARAMATLVHVAPDAEARLEDVRAALDASACDCGASAWNGCLVARFLTVDPAALRSAAGDAAQVLTGGLLPRSWSC